MNPLFLKLIQPLPFKTPLLIDDDGALSDVRDAAIEHNLLMLVYSRLKEHVKEFGADIHIQRFLDNERDLYLSNALQSVRQEAVENDIISFLRHKGTPSVVIKGNAMAREVYNDPNCRSSSDIDMLIRRGDAFSVNSILLNSGYEAETDIPFRYSFYHLHHAGYFQPKYNVHIEIHWHFGLQHCKSLTPHDIWQGVVRDESGLCRLSPEMTIILLLLHHHHHAFREMRVLVDILWAFYKYGRVINPGRFVKKLKEHGLLKIAFIAVQQIMSIWHDTVREIQFIADIRRELKNAGCRMPQFLTSYFMMQSHKGHHSNIKDRFMTRLTHDKRTDIILSYFRSILPHPEAIKGLYGDKRLWKLPVNYLRFIIWRIKE